MPERRVSWGGFIFEGVEYNFVRYEDELGGVRLDVQRKDEKPMDGPEKVIVQTYYWNAIGAR